MAYSKLLAERIRDALGARSGLDERKMFGGIAFLVGGNMPVGVVGEDLMVRLGPDAERALAEPHVRPMDFTGKPSMSMIYVDAAGIETDANLASWVEAGADYAQSLPPKSKKWARRGRTEPCRLMHHMGAELDSAFRGSPLGSMER